MNRAFTLIEALAVVAILGLVAATLAISLGSAAHASAWQRAQTAVLQFDRMVRLEARANGPIQIAIDGDGDSIIATCDGNRAPVLRSDPLGSGARSMPRFALVAADHHLPAMAREATALESVQIDAAGRSIDFAYQLSDGAELLRLQVAGLTGYLREERD